MLGIARQRRLERTLQATESRAASRLTYGKGEFTRRSGFDTRSLGRPRQTERRDIDSPGTVPRGEKGAGTVENPHESREETKQPSGIQAAGAGKLSLSLSLSFCDLGPSILSAKSRPVASKPTVQTRNPPGQQMNMRGTSAGGQEHARRAPRDGLPGAPRSLSSLPRSVLSLLSSVSSTPLGLAHSPLFPSGLSLPRSGPTGCARGNGGVKAKPSTATCRSGGTDLGP